jgi:replicative DNA helicase
MNRTVPHDVQAEQAVVGSLMIDNGLLDRVTNLTPDDFYHSGNKLIFSAIMELTGAGQVADLVTVSEKLTSSGNIKKAGGSAYVAEVVDAVVLPSSIGSYAQTVKKNSVERTIISEAEKIINAVYETSDDSKSKLEEAQKTILNLSLDKNNDTLRSSREITQKAFQEIETRYSKHGGLIGIPSGLIDLDSHISGLIGGDLIILAGRPGMGKSALAGCIAANVAEDGNTAAIFSLEMPGESVITRIVANRASINSRHLRRGFISDNAWPGITAACGSVASWNLFIDDKPDVTPAEIRAKARKLKKEHNLGLLIVDYIQLVRVTGKPDSREQAIAEISRTLKAIARELDIPVIGLSQLNRQVDGRPDKHPMLSDLRESGAIEQDADIVVFIYRDEAYNKNEDNPKRGIAELDIAKHRNGETGRFEVIFDAKTQRFRNMVKR